MYGLIWENTKLLSKVCFVLWSDTYPSIPTLVCISMFLNDLVIACFLKLLVDLTRSFYELDHLAAAGIHGMLHIIKYLITYNLYTWAILYFFVYFFHVQSHRMYCNLLEGVSSTANTELRLKCSFRRAVSYFELKLFDKAVLDLTDLLNADPNSIQGNLMTQEAH